MIMLPIPFYVNDPCAHVCSTHLTPGVFTSLPWRRALARVGIDKKLLITASSLSWSVLRARPKISHRTPFRVPKRSGYH